MTPGLRKFVLTAHITTLVGWLGAVVAYLAPCRGDDGQGGLLALSKVSYRLVAAIAV